MRHAGIDATSACARACGAPWEHFQRSAEASDGEADPLDRWSRRIIGLLAREFGAQDFYPNGTAPQLSFQRLAARCEPVHPSPIGILIHERWGLWHSYRGALGLPLAMALSAVHTTSFPCGSCGDRPCLSACPVGAEHRYTTEQQRFHMAAFLANLGGTP